VNEVVDFRHLQGGDFSRCARAVEQPAGDRHRRFVARADGNDAGHELLENRRMAESGQFKQGSLGKGGNGFAQPPHGYADVERLFHSRAARFADWWHRWHNSYLGATNGPPNMTFLPPPTLRTPVEKVNFER